MKDPLEQFIENKSAKLLAYAHSIVESADSTIINGSLLRIFISEATSLKETLDYYGAHASQSWFMFREITAALLVMSKICYVTLHIKDFSPHYHLDEDNNEFKEKTLEILSILRHSFSSLCKELVLVANKKNFLIYKEKVIKILSDTEIVNGHFPHDLALPITVWTQNSTVKLATDFLNLSGEFNNIKSPLFVNHDSEKELEKEQYSEHEYEEKIRLLLLKIYHLQSVYDIYLQDTATENLDFALVKMRGLVAVIYHLLEIAVDLILYSTNFCSYIKVVRAGGDYLFKNVLSFEKFNFILNDYLVFHIKKYFKDGVVISKEILANYVIPTEMEVPIPYYRGFHVRPSTLVAQVVAHYGSKVTLEVGDESFFASSPMELFRANETINRIKRNKLAVEVDVLAKEKSVDRRLTIKEKSIHIIHRLIENGNIIVYDTIDFKYGEVSDDERTSLREYTMETLARLMALGKIDSTITFNATIKGDERVLKDLKILAEHGYGEDRYGNNITLPLSYLRR